MARLLRCSWEAVSAIIARVVDDTLGPARLTGLRRIGVDEIRYRYRTFLTIVVNHDDGGVVWIGEGRRASTLGSFFAEIGPRQAAVIDAMSCDLGEAYVSAARAAIPGARICFDPFHVVGLANDALDSVRKQIRRRRSDDVGTDNRLHRGLRWALLKGAGELTVAQHQILDDLRRFRHVLWRAWSLKEELRGLYAIADPTRAASYLRWWLSRASRSRIPQMVELARRLRRHFDGIVAAVELGLSNSRLEGLNSKIRLINHRGYGHHSAAALAAMIYLCCGGVEVALPFR